MMSILVCNYLQAANGSDLESALLFLSGDWYPSNQIDF